MKLVIIIQSQILQKNPLTSGISIGIYMYLCSTCICTVLFYTFSVLVIPSQTDSLILNQKQILAKKIQFEGTIKNAHKRAHLRKNIFQGGEIGFQFLVTYVLFLIRSVNFENVLRL